MNLVHFTEVNRKHWIIAGLLEKISKKNFWGFLMCPRLIEIKREIEDLFFLLILMIIYCLLHPYHKNNLSLVAFLYRQISWHMIHVSVCYIPLQSMEPLSDAWCWEDFHSVSEMMHSYLSWVVRNIFLICVWIHCVILSCCTHLWWFMIITCLIFFFSLVSHLCRILMRETLLASRRESSAMMTMELQT